MYVFCKPVNNETMVVKKSVRTNKTKTRFVWVGAILLFKKSKRITANRENALKSKAIATFKDNPTINK